MAHNVVVLQINTDIDTLLKEGAPHRETDFIPPAMAANVIAKIVCRSRRARAGDLHRA